MSVSPEELLAFAEDIYSIDKASEVQYRSAISRYYYAMYHKTRSILKMEPRSYGKGEHENLIRYLQSDVRHDEDHNFKELVKLGEFLRIERDRRNVADYEIDQSVNELNADSSKQSAEFLFEKADILMKISSVS